jgi:predicted AAA+ superfamily ATPase
MFKRTLGKTIVQRAKKIPVIAILGPRQSGKTTLTRAVFNKHAYVSLEIFEDRELAEADPKRFFETNVNKYGLIIDEVQRAPKLLSYMQSLVDAEYKPGYFVITGSQNILLTQAISQTLAGRISIITLLPLSIEELRANKLLPKTIEAATFPGFYPRIYEQQPDPVSWYEDYLETYVERDARTIVNIAQLNTFRRFIRLCAGRVGQLVNITSLATDCGIDQRTAKAWLSVLEASYIIFFLQPHHVNFNKRLIKAPKLYFYDSGLVCSLLEIQSIKQLDDHYLRGNIIESMLVADIIKHYYHHGQRPHHVYFWRDQTGNEIDCVISKENKLVPIEIKASKTVTNDFFKGLEYFSSLSKTKSATGYLVYGGSKDQKRAYGTVVSWQHIDKIFKG